MTFRSCRRLATVLVAGAFQAAAAQGPLAPTTATSIGIFYQPGAPETPSLWRDGDPGEKLQLRGRVLDTGGAPVAGALVEIWHADGAGHVDESRYRASLRTARDGSFRLRTVLPGYIGMAAGDPVWGARHIHVVVSHPDYERLITLVFFRGDPELALSPYPELAIFLEEGRVGDERVMFGAVDIVLAPR